MLGELFPTDKNELRVGDAISNQLDNPSLPAAKPTDPLAVPDASKPPAKRFRVALTFAGEKRAFVAEIASMLAKRFGEDKILYDKYHEAEFARRNLGVHLPNLYHNNSDLIVVVICRDYVEKEWCGLEWNAIHDLLKKNKDDYVMLCRFGDATLDNLGIYSTAGFLDLDGKTPKLAATRILERLALNEGKPKKYYLKAKVAVSKLQTDRQAEATVAIHVLSAKSRLPHWSDAAQVKFSITNLTENTAKLARLELQVLKRTPIQDVAFRKAGAPVSEFQLKASIGDEDNVDLLKDLDTQFVLGPGSSDAFNLALRGPEGFLIECRLCARIDDLVTKREFEVASDTLAVEYPIRSLAAILRQKRGEQ